MLEHKQYFTVGFPNTYGRLSQKNEKKIFLVFYANQNIQIKEICAAGGSACKGMHMQHKTDL